MSGSARDFAWQKRSWSRTLFVVIVLFAIIRGGMWWDGSRFSASRLAGKKAHEVVEMLGPPSWAVAFDPYPDKPDVKRVINDEAIRVVSEGGSGDFIYNRLASMRYRVRFARGVVTNAEEGSK